MQNLSPGVLSPYNLVVDYQRFASSLSYANTRPPTATVNEDGTIVTYKDKTMEVEHWITGLRKLFSDVKEDVANLCHNNCIAVNIPDIIPDDMTERTRGYGWLNNGKFVKDRALIQILMNDSSIDLCTKGKNGLIFKPGSMLRIMEKTTKINGHIAVLCHTLPGQPSRISELMDSKIRNSTRPRTFFRNHGADWLVTRRVKYENQIRREVFIPSKLPPELQELVDFYLLVIRQLEVDLARKLWGEEVAVLYHEYFFMHFGKRMTESQFSSTLQSVSETYFGTSLTIRPYRQLVVLIAKVYLGSEYEIYEEDEVDVLAEQTGHSTMARRNNYAIECGLLPGVSSDLMLRFGHASEWWWRLTRFYPNGVPLLPLRQRRKIRESFQTPRLLPTTIDSTSPPPTTVDLGRLVEQLTGVITTSVTQMKMELEQQIQIGVAAGIAEFMQRQNVLVAPVHDNQQVILEPPPILQSNETSSGHVDDFDDIYALDQPLDVNPNPQPVDDVALRLLQQIFPDKPDVNFLTEQQRQMVELSLSRERSFVGILPTGGGKSMVFLLPALLETNLITLVVIPNKALLLDMIRKTRAYGIPTCQWTSAHRQIGDARVVYLAMESVTSLGFRE
jgi:DEAD/DEAH box helicase